MNIGLIEFGNGIIMPDGDTVSLAMNVHTISSDLDSVKSSIESMVQQKGFTSMVQKKGFTNMVQALALAETL